MKILVKGGGMYGCVIADTLMEQGHEVYLHDPHGLLVGASFKNFRRLHRGYHYPHQPAERRLVAFERFTDRYGHFCQPCSVFYSIADKSKEDPYDYARFLREQKLPHRWIRTTRECSIAEWGIEGQEAFYNIEAAREYFSKRLHVVETEVSADFTIAATYLQSPLAKSLKKKKTKTYHLNQGPKWGRTILLGNYGGFFPCSEGGVIAYHAGTNDEKKAIDDLKTWFREISDADVLEVREATILHPKSGADRPYFLEWEDTHMEVVGGKVADSILCAEEIGRQLA